MAYPFAVLRDAVRTAVVSYAPGSGSMTVANASAFPVPSAGAPILITAVVAASYGTYPESYGTFEATGVSGNTFLGLVLISGADLPFVSGDILEMRTCAKHVNDLAAPFGASGNGHAPGLVPDPGPVAGAVRYLREDKSWGTPAGGGVPGGSNGQIQWNNNGVFAGFTTSGDAAINASTGQVVVTGTGGQSFAPSAVLDTTNAVNISSGVLAVARVPALGASGAGHGAGVAPDPGATAGSARFLCENAVWSVPPGTPTLPGGTGVQIQYRNTAGGFGGFTMGGDGAINVLSGLMTISSVNGVPFAGSATVDTTSATNISSGVLPVGRLPAISGDAQMVAGSGVLTVTRTGGVPFAASATVDATNAANISSGILPLARVPLFVGSGAGHAPGLVPDPGAAAGSGRYLREDGTWVAPPGGGVGSPPGGTAGQFQVNAGGGSFGGVTVSGDLTISSTGVGLVTMTAGVAFARSATVDATNASNITSGTLPSAQLPFPGSAALGGILAGGFVTNQWLIGINGVGALISSQPAFANLAGVATVAQLPMMGASGPTTHAPGIVPDTPLVPNTTRFLREDATWVIPPGNPTVPGGTSGQIQFANGAAFGGFTAGGDATINTATGAVSVTRAGGVAFAASATTDTTNAANISSGTLPAARLPVPTTGSLGGVQANTPVANQWVIAITSSGVPQLLQPGFGNIAGTVAPAQLPLPTNSTLGGVFANTPIANQWMASINPSGVPVLSQPAFASLSGAATLAQLPAIATLTGLVNATGAAAAPQAVSLSAWNNAAIGTAQGMIAYRGASGWLGAVQVLTGTPLESGPYTAVPGDLVQASTSSGPITITLPSAPADHTKVSVTHLVQGGTNAVTVACGGTDTFFILGQPTSIFLPYQGQTVTLQYQAAGGIWYIVGSDSNTRNTGDYVFSSVPNTTVNLTSTVNVAVTSIVLPAGDWDIGGLGYFVGTGATWIGPNAFGAGPSTANNNYVILDCVVSYPFVASNVSLSVRLPLGSLRQVLTAATTFYLVVNSTFTAGTVTAGGFIRARRFR